MSPAYKPILLLGIIIVSVAVLTLVARFNEPKEIIPWRTDYAAAEAESAATNKPLFLYFTADWCAACQQMKHTTWNEPSVAKALGDFVTVKIDVDDKPELGSRYAVQFLPSFRVVKADGKALGPDDAAFQTNEGLISWLGTVK